MVLCALFSFHKEEEMEKKTVLYDTHVRMGARIVPFAGYLMPVQYTDILKEHMAVRTAAGLFDVSHMGEITLEGKDAIANLNHLLTNDYTKMKEGKVRYSPMCYENGGVVDDLLVYKYNDEKYLIVVNASNKDKDYAWMKEHAFGDVVLEDISDRVAQIKVSNNTINYYGSLTDAFKAVAVNQTIQLLADVNEAVSTKDANAATFTLDLNGYDLTNEKTDAVAGASDKATITVTTGKNVTICNSSKDDDSTINNGFDGKEALNIATGASVTIGKYTDTKLVILDRSNETGAAWGKTTGKESLAAGKANSANTVTNDGKLEIVNATVKNNGVYSYAINNSAANSELVIVNGAFEGGRANINNAGDLVVNNGTFTAVSKPNTADPVASEKYFTEALIINGGTAKIGAIVYNRGNEYTNLLMHIATLLTPPSSPARPPRVRLTLLTAMTA
jgi:hypothetical protein